MSDLFAWPHCVCILLTAAFNRDRLYQARLLGQQVKEDNVSTSSILIGIGAGYLLIGVVLLARACYRRGPSQTISDYFYAVLLWPWNLSDLLE